MTTIKLKLKDLNLRLAEKSAIYLTQKRHTKDGETPCFPDLLRTPDPQLKKLYEIGLSKSLFKIKGWVTGYTSTPDEITIDMTIAADSKEFVETLLNLSAESHILAETFMSCDEKLSSYFANRCTEATEALVCYLAYIN